MRRGAAKRAWIGISVLLAGPLVWAGLAATVVAQPASPSPNPAVSQETDQERLNRIQQKLKMLDPSMVIYLDSRGNVAGAGDPAGVVGRAEQAGKAAHPPALELSGFPKDQYGLIDWAATIMQGKIKPRDAIDPTVPEVPPLDLDIVITTKSKYQPDDVFSHKIHTMWLACQNCHDKIFKMKAGGNPEMHMTKIAAGEYCGRCHDRVAFPLTDCLRCHVKPKEGSP